MLYGDLGYFQQQMREHSVEASISRADFLQESIVYHGHAYYAGSISVDRMLDVVVDPFLRLAKAVSQPPQFPEGPPSSLDAASLGQERFRAMFLRTWNNAVYWALQGIYHDTDTSYALIPGVTNKKQTKLRQGVVKANFIQVKF